MRNLELYDCRRYKLPDGCVLDSVYDSEGNRLFFVQDRCLSVFDGTQTLNLCELAMSQITDVSISFLDDIATVCVAFNEGTEGNVLLYNLDTEQSECVGTVEGGILCSKWSPDQEIFLLVTKATGKVLLMNREFDLLKETEIYSESFGEGAPVTVGWGKKETQFHGSEGKESREIKVEVKKSLADWDDGFPRISWRGDGKYFAVSTVEPEKEIRRLKIFDREGELQYTSEPVSFLEPGIAWKPSGSLIAASQRTPTGYQVVFFETNGLRHGEFKMDPNLKVVSIAWNNDSTLLALHCKRRKDESSVIQLWNTGNYHWYLKQEMGFADGISVQTYFWDAVKPCRLHTALSDGEYRQYSFRLSTTKSCGADERDLASVYVVDGARIKVTPFRKLIVPPPMSAYEIHLPVTPMLVLPARITENFDPNSFSALLPDGSVLLFGITTEASAISEDVKVTGAGGNGFNVRCGTHSLVSRHYLAVDGVVNGGLFVSPDSFVIFHVTVSGQMVSKYQLGGLNVKGDPIASESLSQPIESYCLLNTEEVIILTSSKTLYRLSVSDLTVKEWSVPSGLSGSNRTCSKMEAVIVGCEEFVFILADTGHLYFNGSLLISGVTGFETSTSFLLVTTYEHTLRCIPLLKSGLENVRDGKALANDESVRRVERGSRIVTQVPLDTKVVLQMPRGNLEVIHPRVLVIQAVAEDLRRSKYRSAFVAMRRHRINLNFLVDHNPEKFVSELELFIDDVEDQAWISQFVTDLQTEEISFSELVQQKSKVDWKPNKVDDVCSRILKVLEKRPLHTYLFSILTCHVKMTKPDYDEALKIVLELRSGEEINPAAPKLFLEGLRYLSVLVDIDILYRTALGTYDLTLALLVAENSQKDPKEFLPFLQDLESKDENNRRYLIDLFLKRYDRALHSFVKCGPSRFDEFTALVAKHSLYREALDVVEPGSENKKVISIAFAEYLISNKNVYEAGVYYFRAGAFTDALSCFRKSLDWKMVFACGIKLKYSESELKKLYRETAQLLANSKRQADAVAIYRTYLNDFQAALPVAVEGSLWEEVLFCSFHIDDPDSERKVAEEELITGAVSLKSRILDFEETFEKSVKRLEVVRKEKDEKEILLGLGEEIENPLDAQSEIGSTTTGTVTTASRQTGSSRTARSSKNRRKLEKKLYSTKPGSPYEDLGIVVSLHELMGKTFELREEVFSLCKALLHIQREKMALDLQDSLENLIIVMVKKSRIIWPTAKFGEEEHEFGPEATAANIISSGLPKFDRVTLLEPHLRHPPAKPEIKWRISLK